MQQRCVAAPETAKGRHKSGISAKRTLISAAVAAALLGGGIEAQALLTGGQVSSGTASVLPSGSTLTVNQI